MADQPNHGRDIGWPRLLWGSAWAGAAMLLPTGSWPWGFASSLAARALRIAFASDPEGRRVAEARGLVRRAD